MLIDQLLLIPVRHFTGHENSQPLSKIYLRLALHFHKAACSRQAIITFADSLLLFSFFVFRFSSFSVRPEGTKRSYLRFISLISGAVKTAHVPIVLVFAPTTIFEISLRARETNKIKTTTAAAVAGKKNKRSVRCRASRRDGMGSNIALFGIA